MKKLFITLIVCICVVLIVTIITRTDLFNKKTTPNISQKNNYDVSEMLENILNISNIYVEYTDMDNKTTYIYKKDYLEKTVSNYSTKIFDTKDNISKVYKTDSKEGIISPISDLNYKNSYFYYCNTILDTLKNNKYEILNDSINGKDCIKVVFKDEDFEAWFEKENNLLIKIYSNKTNGTVEFKNIKINSLTDDDFKVPNDVILKEVK